MYRYQILIEYVGTEFIGWQVQKNGDSIQSLIQKKLSKILKEKISVMGSGRTDSGVHANQQIANFKFDTSIKPKDIKNAINSHLKNDVYINSCEYIFFFCLYIFHIVYYTSNIIIIITYFSSNLIVDILYEYST